MSIRNDLLEKIYEAVSSGGNTDAYIQNLISQQTGWAVFADDAATLASPQVILEDSTEIITNNSGLTIVDQTPSDAGVPMWDSVNNKFIPISENDCYTWIVRFKAKNTAANGGYINVGMDIGGTFGILFTESHLFVRGANVEQEFNIPMYGYVGSTFIANGGIPKLTSFNGDTSIYNKELHIIRHHKGR